MWSKLYFGKHAGKSLPQILFYDPDYFFWSIEKKVFKDRLAVEADKLTRMVRHIRIPKPDPKIGASNIFSRRKINFPGSTLFRRIGGRT